MSYKFNKGQTVYFLFDPTFDDEEEDPAILVGTIHHFAEDYDTNCYNICSNGDHYEREEEDVYSSLEEATEAVNTYFAEILVEQKENIAQIKAELKEAKADLAALDQRINKWQVKSHQQPTK